MSRIFQQVVEDGYEFFAKRQLVTLFSAPNYCGEFDNAGGMMSVDESLMCSFQVCTHVHFCKLPFDFYVGIVLPLSDYLSTAKTRILSLFLCVLRFII